MQDKEFDDIINERVKGLKLEPTPEVWNAIEKELHKDDRKIGWWWFLLPLGLVVGGGIYFATIQVKQVKQLTIPESINRSELTHANENIEGSVAKNVTKQEPTFTADTFRKEISAGINPASSVNNKLQNGTGSGIDGKLRTKNSTVSKQDLGFRNEQSAKLKENAKETHTFISDNFDSENSTRKTLVSLSLPKTQPTTTVSADTLSKLTTLPIYTQVPKQILRDTGTITVPKSELTTNTGTISTGIVTTDTTFPSKKEIKSKKWVLAGGIIGGKSKPSELMGGRLLFKMNGTSNDMAEAPLMNNSGGITNVPLQTFSVSNYSVDQFSYYGIGVSATKPIGNNLAFITGLNIFNETYKVQNVILNYSLQTGSYLYSLRRADSGSGSKRYHHLGLQVPLGIQYQPFRFGGFQFSYVNNYVFGLQQIIDTKKSQLTGYRGMLRLSANIQPDNRQRISVIPFYELGIKQLPDNKRWSGWGLGLYYNPGKK